jgi:hypothetical protein
MSHPCSTGQRTLDLVGVFFVNSTFCVVSVWNLKFLDKYQNTDNVEEGKVRFSKEILS